MKTVKLGDYNNLTVTRMATRENPHAFGGVETFGVFLDGGDEGEILMPQKYVPAGTVVGSEVRCFVYLDQEERLVATREEPLAKVGDFAWLECVWVNQFGAFLDWGVMKNLFCPFSEQKRKMEKGQRYLVYIYVDDESYRIVASAKVEHFLSEGHPDGKAGDEVSLLVWQKTPLGFKVIVNNRWQGLIYDDQIFQSVHSGDCLKGYIQQIRPDGKIDITLQPVGRRQTLDFAATLLQWLKDHDGWCPLGDKSDPDDIKRVFSVSKKTFKKAVGDLYKRHLIILKEEGIQLL